jgi:hypothetical protein
LIGPVATDHPNMAIKDSLLGNRDPIVRMNYSNGRTNYPTLTKNDPNERTNYPTLTKNDPNGRTNYATLPAERSLTRPIVLPRLLPSRARPRFIRKDG